MTRALKIAGFGALLVSAAFGGMLFEIYRGGDLIVVRDRWGCYVWDQAAHAYPRNAHFEMRDGKCRLSDWRLAHLFQ